MFADLRFAFRGLVNTPGFAAHAFVTLGLGFGSFATSLAILRGLAGTPLAVLERPVQVLTVITVLLLTAAGANFATLLLARVDARHRELAIRRAMGAGRRRLIALLLVESVLLALIGASLGLLAGAWAVDWTAAAISPAPGASGLSGVDRTVAGIVLALAGPLALAFGIIPARRAARADVHDVLRDDAPAAPLGPVPPRGAGAVLVAFEMTLSVLLLVAWLSSRAAGAAAGTRGLVDVLLGLCALTSVALTTLGIYVVTAYDLGRRSREIGVRLALGARSGDVLRLTIAAGMQAVVAGLLIGLVASLGVHRQLERLHVGSEPATSATLALVGLTLAGVALAATSLPARRAIRAIPTRPPTSA